jgi:predicted NUDIX family phosphoesterase
MELTQIEHVLVVPTQLFHSLGYFQGFSGQVDQYLTALLDPVQLKYLPRDEMENDPSFKQLIPYCIFRHRDENGVTRLFQYTRGKGGEVRLHAKKSIGVGGHISSVDGEGSEAYREGLTRELAEEVAIETVHTENVIGLINDDQTPVGRVHLGVVHLFDVETPTIQPREASLALSGFQTVEQILSEIDAYETWSQITLRALFQD